jgi:hypothetical protein
MEKKVILICGYKTTGKDSLFQKLIGNNTYNWFVYKRNEVPNLSELIKDKKLSRYGFADELKKEVGIFSENKEEVRHLYIQYANERRSEDINYFCRKVYIKMLDDSDNDIFIITDFRFYNELYYMCARFSKCYTIRIFRKEVEIPDINIESEHQLDDLLTDYLLINDDISNKTDLWKNNYIYSEQI